MALVVNVHLGITALKALLTPSHVIQEHIMVAMKELAQVYVCYALMALSAIHLVLMFLMDNVQLVTTVQLDSQ